MSKAVTAKAERNRTIVMTDEELGVYREKLVYLAEKVDEIEDRALVAARELSVGTIDQLQTILLVVLAELVVVPGKHCQWVQSMEKLKLCSNLLERPSQSADDIDTVFIYALEHLA